jgi:transposase-like protein
MSRQRKRDAVVRLLRGEDLETVSRSLGVTAATLSGWRDAFLTAGEASLASRPADGEALESERLKARLGEMLLERELLEAKITALQAGRPCMGLPVSSVFHVLLRDEWPASGFGC